MKYEFNSNEEEKQSKEPPSACRSCPSLLGRVHGSRTKAYGHGTDGLQNGTLLRVPLRK